MNRSHYPTGRCLAIVIALLLCLLADTAPARATECHAPPAVVAGPAVASTAPFAWSMPDPRLVIGNRTRMIQFVAIGMMIALWIMFRNK